MSDDPGYKIIKGAIPSTERIVASRKDYEQDHLRLFRKSQCSLGFEKLGWGKESDKLLRDGLDLNGDTYLESLLGRKYADAKSIIAQHVVWMRNLTPIERLKAGKGRVFIYMATEEALGPDNGFFRIVEGSHQMKDKDVINVPAKDIHLNPGEAIVMDGDLVIEYPQTGGGLGLLLCLNKTGDNSLGKERDIVHGPALQ